MEEEKKRKGEEDCEADLRPLQCPNCKKVYSLKTEAKFKNHLKTCGKGQYQCDICEKNYFSLISLKKHIKCHLIGAVFRCLTCGKDFKTKFKLSLHSRIHKDKAERENERFQCEYCNKTFAWQSSLSRHMQSHFQTDEDAYTCKCGEGFTKYSKFYLHKKDCSVGKKDIKMTREITVSVDLSLHRCQLCNQGFKDRDKLDAHVLSCDPFSFSSDSKAGILMSEDEKAGIEKVLTEKMAKFVDATPKVKRTDKGNAYTCENLNTIGSQKPVGGIDDDIEVKKEDGKTVETVKTEIISESPDKIIPQTEEDDSTDNEMRNSQSRPLTGNKRWKNTKIDVKQTKLGKQKKGTLLKNQTVKRSKRNYEPKVKVNRSRKKMESETGGNRSSFVALPVKIENTDANILSTPSVTASRRTGRIRKQKQFPGYDVELPFLHNGKDSDIKQRKTINLNMEVETFSTETFEQTEIQQATPNRHSTHDCVQTETEEGYKADRIVDFTESEGNEGTMSEENKSADFELLPTSPPILEEDPGKVQDIFPERETDTVAENMTMALESKIRTEKSTGDKYIERGTHDAMRVLHNFLLTPNIDGGKTFITYECLIKSCSKVLHSIKKLSSHKKLVHKALFRYLCTGCGKEFGSFSVYRSHIRMEHSNTESLVFQLKDVKITIKDENKVVGKEILVCTKCGYRYGNLQEPKHECEPVELEYYCPCCSYHSKLCDEITEHITTNHKGEYHAIKNKDQYQNLRSADKEPGWNIGDTATTCSVCHLKLETNQDLKHHMNMKHAVRPFACGLCKICYGRKNALKRHLLTHKASQWKCPFCNKEFYEKDRLETHKLTHTGERPYQCEICGNRYCDEKGVKQHMMFKHLPHYKSTFPNSRVNRTAENNINSMPAVCHLCGQTLGNEAYLQKHMRKHKEASVYKCLYCNETFSEKKSLREHKSKHTTITLPKQGTVAAITNCKSKDLYKQLKVFKEDHPSGLPYGCGLCHKRFSRVKGANQHIRSVHLNETDRKFVCHICGRGFAIASGLHAHMRLHTNSKPYRCKICDKRYRQLAHVRQHLLYHGKPSYKCRICSKQFKIRSNLKAHVNTHCEVLPYKCPVKECTMAFQNFFPFLAHLSTCLETLEDDFPPLKCNFCGIMFVKGKLIAHYHTHENEDHFPCGECGMSFKTYPSLYFHKEEKNHFKASELFRYSNNAFSTMNKQKLYEFSNDWSTKFLMEQYDYIEEEDELPLQTKSESDSVVYTEQYKIEEDINNEGELILIAEQLTHMASGVPFREVIVQATDDGNDNVTTLTIEELDKSVEGFRQIGEIEPETVGNEKDSLADRDEQRVDENAKGKEADDVDYHFIVEEGQTDSTGSGDALQASESHQCDDTETVVTGMSHGEIADSGIIIPEKCEINDYEYKNSELDKIIVDETSVEEVVESCDIKEALVTDTVKNPIRFIDQAGNEIIVYVLDETGEQIQLTDSEEILNTVVQSGDYSILENTGTELVEEYQTTNETFEIIEHENTTEYFQDASQRDFNEDMDGIKKELDTSNKNKLSTQRRPQREIQNTDKIKGSINRDFESSMESIANQNLHIKVSMNYYEERSVEFAFECSICKKRFPTKKARNFHAKTHLPNNLRKYQCEVCGSGFHTPVKLSIHKRIHTKERPHKCDICGKTFNQVGHLRTHLRLHLKYYPFECEKCDKKYISNAQLTRHYLNCHTESKEENFQCRKCGLLYRDEVDLQIHQLQHLNKEERQNFLSSCNLAEGVEIGPEIFEHVKAINKTTRRGSAGNCKNFVCETCGAVMRGEATLLAHQALHRSEKFVLNCSVCDISFSDKILLDRHMSSHNIDGVSCDICGLFIRSKWLKKHMAKHEASATLNYQCKKCGKQYKLEYSFMRHIVGCLGGEFKDLFSDEAVI